MKWIKENGAALLISGGLSLAIFFAVLNTPNFGRTTELGSEPNVVDTPPQEAVSDYVPPLEGVWFGQVKRGSKTFNVKLDLDAMTIAQYQANKTANGCGGALVDVGKEDGSLRTAFKQSVFCKTFGWAKITRPADNPNVVTYEWRDHMNDDSTFTAELYAHVQ